MWDYVVVGAGSAGCALAHALATSERDASILIIEAGGWDGSPWIRFAATQVLAVARHDWGYVSEPDPSRHGNSESWPRGKVIGGSSTINGTMYVRGAAQDFDHWAAVCGGAGGWAASDVMPLFRELEASDRAEPLRGRRGPVYVRTVQHAHECTERFLAAAVRCGHSFNTDYNGASQEGVGHAQLSQRRGMRWSAADAFLKPLLRKKNVRLLLNSTVRRVELDNYRARAVSFVHKAREYSEAARNIILCAGAIESPKILMQSGIGPARELSHHGLPTVIDLPGVGRNLREHPLLRLVYRTRIPSYNLTGGWRQKARFAWQFLRTAEGPMSNLFEGVAFLRSSAGEARPDIQLHFMPFGYSNTADRGIELASFPSVTVLLNKSYPLSIGHIRLRSANPDDPPLIECRLLENEADADTMVRGIELVRRIMREEPIASAIQSEVSPGPEVRDTAQLLEYVRTHTSIAFHPVGTCRMGIDAEAVVAPDLRVRGTENLWIADGSIMPSLISANTNAACMMIGSKLGKQLAAKK